MLSEGVEEAIELVETPLVPIALSESWWIFEELQGTRQSGGFGAGPISYQEMLAWSSLEGFPIRRWHRVAVRALDDAFLSIMSKDTKDLDFKKLAEDPSWMSPNLD